MGERNTLLKKVSEFIKLEKFSSSLVWILDKPHYMSYKNDCVCILVIIYIIYYICVYVIYISSNWACDIDRSHIIVCAFLVKSRITKWKKKVWNMDSKKLTSNIKLVCWCVPSWVSMDKLLLLSPKFQFSIFSSANAYLIRLEGELNKIIHTYILDIKKNSNKT